MQITIHNRTNSNLNFKLSPINKESFDVIEIPQNQTKMVLTQGADNVLELWEGEFPFNERRFYELKSPAEILINEAKQVFIFDSNRNLNELLLNKEKEFFDSNTIHVVNLSEKPVYARIDNPGKYGNSCNDNSNFYMINPGAFYCWKRNLNQLFTMQVGSQMGVSNGVNYVLKAGYEYSIDNDMNVISNLTAKIYYSHKQWNEYIDVHDVLSLDFTSNATPINKGADMCLSAKGNLFTQLAVQTQINENHEKTIYCVYRNDELNLLLKLGKENIIIHNDTDLHLNVRLKSIGVGDEEISRIDPKHNAKWPREPGFYLTEISFLFSNNKNECENYKSCFYLQENKIFVFTKEFFLIDYTTCEILKPTPDAFNIETLGYLDSETYFEINKQSSDSDKDQIYFYGKDMKVNSSLELFKVQKENIESAESKFNLGLSFLNENKSNNIENKNCSQVSQNKRKLSDDLYDINQINQNSFNLLPDCSYDKTNNNNNYDDINKYSQPKIVYEKLNVKQFNKFIDINEIGYENNFDINKIRKQIVNNSNKNSLDINNSSNNEKNNLSSSFPLNTSNNIPNPNLKSTSIKNLSEKTICVRTQANQTSKATDGYFIIALGESLNIARESGLYVLELNTVKKQKFYFVIAIGWDYKYLEDGFLINSSTGEPVAEIADKDPESLLDRETDAMQIGFIQNFFTNNLCSTVETLLSKKEFCGICLLELDANKESLEMHFKFKHTVNFGKSILFDTPNIDDTFLSKGSARNYFKEIDACLEKMNISQSNAIEEEKMKKSFFDYAKLLTDESKNNNTNIANANDDDNFKFKLDCGKNNLFDNQNIDNKNKDDKNVGVKSSKVILDINDASVNNESKHFMNDAGSGDKNDRENNNSDNNLSKNNISINIVNHSNTQKIINVDVKQSEIDREFNKEKFSLIERFLLKIDEKIDNIQKKMEEDWEKRENEKSESEASNKKFEDNFKDLRKNLNKGIKKYDKSLRDNNKLLIELKAEQRIIKNTMQKQSDKIQFFEGLLITKHEELKKIYEDLNKQSSDNFDDNFHKIEKELFKVNKQLAEEKKELADFSIPKHWEKGQINDLLLCKLDTSSDEYLNFVRRFKSTLPLASNINITRIQNLSLWKNFCFSKYQLNNKGNATQKLLFHGTKTTDPQVIYGGTEEGFDLRFSQQGMWGIGCYFHQNAIYSDKYRYRKNGIFRGGVNSTNIMLVADVLVGNSKTLNQNNSLRLPPFIEGSTTERYDSVNSGDGIYIIYNNQRAYPAYIIEYDN